MIAGLYFYWLSWLSWIMIFFFMSKSKEKSFLLFLLLISMVTANIFYQFYNYQISLTYILLLFVSLFRFSKMKWGWYELFCGFTIMIGFAAISFWINHTPIWVFVHHILLIPIFITFLTSFLIKGLNERIIIGTLGVTMGEIFYHFILKSYGIHIVIGNLTFLDQYMLGIFLLVIVTFAQSSMQKVYMKFNLY